MLFGFFFAKTILSVIMLFGLFFAIAYLINYHLRRKTDGEKNATKNSIKVGLLAATIDMLIFFSFRFFFPTDGDQKGLPEWYPVREGWGVWLFSFGLLIGIIVVYLSPIFIVRMVLSKRRK